jgi:hypothetical protein
VGRKFGGHDINAEEVNEGRDTNIKLDEVRTYIITEEYMNVNDNKFEEEMTDTIKEEMTCIIEEEGK